MSLRFATFVSSMSFAVCLAASAADTYYADCNRYGKEGSDGKTVATAFGTIQQAVNAAKTGDTVIVLPGVYDKGASVNASENLTSNRVSITKAITVASRDGAARTIIVGASDFAGEPNNGLGPAAVRCAYVGDKAVLRGFTLTGGYVNQNTGSDGDTVRAGGVLLSTSASAGCVVDCVISNNVATRGAGGFGGQFIRTLFKDNRVANTAVSTTINASACRTCYLYNCVIADNGYGTTRTAAQTVGWMRAIVNCTFIGNNSTYLASECYGQQGVLPFKNCLIAHAGKLADSNYSYSHCLTNGVLTATSVATTPHALVASRFGDYRAVTASGVGAAGAVDALADIPEGYQDKDFLGQSRKTGETVSIGAVETPVTPVGGLLVFTAEGAVVSDVPMRAGDYFYAANYPCQVYLASAAPTVEGERFFGYIITSSQWGTYPAFPDRQNGRWLTMPAADASFSVRPQYAPTLYVDAASQAATPDGSSEAPYKTIQAAVNACPSAAPQSYRVITVARGDYYGATYDSSFGSNAVLIVWKNVYLTSEEGAEETRIHGVRPQTDVGDDAVRCLGLTVGNSTTLYNIGVSGFTLVDGATKQGTSGSDAFGQGGAVRVNGGDGTQKCAALNGQILDCVITNCAATRAPGGYQGWYQRCKIVGNKDASGINATTRNNYLSSCVLFDNSAAHNVLGQNVTAYNCSGRGKADTVNYYAAGCTICNSLLVDGSCPDGGTACKIVGSFCDTSGSVKDSRLTRGRADVVSPTDGDFRPYSTSPLLGGGATAGETDEFALWTTSDFENRPLTFVDGKVTIGAYSHAVDRVVTLPSENVVFDCPVTNAVGVGDSVEIRVVHPGEKRHVIGLVVDGVTNLNVFAHTFTYEEGVEHRVAAVTSPDWYVDANAGSDDNAGFTQAAPCKTLAHALRHVLPGDIVHAAEGVYAEGEMMAKMLNMANHSVRSRAVVTNGVTLVASGDVRETIIEGAAATGPSAQNTSNIGTAQQCFDLYGLGTNAMRAVTLYPNAVLKGFTVRKGRTGVYNYPEGEDYLGAGVLGFDATALVEGCVFTSNVTSRATVAYATVRRCRFEDNIGAYNRPVASFSRLENVLAIHNVGNLVADFCTGFYNCTFADNYSGTNRTSTSVRLFYQGGGANVAFVNSVLAQSGTQENIFGDIRNSVFVGGIHYTATNVSEHVSTAATLATVLDAQYRPIKGGPAMDGGSAFYYPAEAGATDLADGQRVYNGAIDMGAYEYDWRGDYAARLSKRVTVDAASPAVCTNAAGVMVPSGALTFRVARQDELAFTLRFAVTGNGLLALTIGDETKTYTQGTYRVDTKPVAADCPMVFAYTPGDNDTGAAILASVTKAGGFTLICR